MISVIYVDDEPVLLKELVADICFALELIDNNGKPFPAKK